MRAVIQRVRQCFVRSAGLLSGQIDEGLLVYLGVGRHDGEKDLTYLVEKVANLRIFADEHGKMNLSASDLGEQIMVVSQFTLFGDARQGRRPSYSAAARPEEASYYYRRFCELLREKGFQVQTGVFAASMEVSYTNVGPVTILLDSEKLF